MKQPKTYTLEQEVLQNFEKEVPKGRRSQVIEKLLNNYADGSSLEAVDEIDERLKEIENEKIQIEEEIEELKSRRAELENERSSLIQKKEEKKDEQKKQERVKEFVDDMVDKFGRSDVRDPGDWFSDYGQGNLKKLENVHGVDLELVELREKFLSRVEEDTGETE